MGIRILLRTDTTISHFRRNLLKMIRSPNSNKLLLCSGYIWEDNGYSILDDELLDAIRSCNDVITIAGKFTFGFERRYERFVKKIKDNHIHIIAYKAHQSNWHAKVAIKLNNENPIAGIIGSSNLTAPAYQENPRNFNYEADVLIWKNDVQYNRYFQDDRMISDNPLSPIEAILNPEIQQINEVGRLRAVYDLIRSLPGLDRYEID